LLAIGLLDGTSTSSFLPCFACHCAILDRVDGKGAVTTLTLVSLYESTPRRDRAFHGVPECGAPVDMRDLGQVLEHGTPLHIAPGGRKKRAAIMAERLTKSGRSPR
jgi:hypothetical protein